MATIKVYARIHPCSCPTSLVEIHGDRLLASKNARTSQRCSTTEIGFTFDSIFQGNATQTEVFDNAARDVVEKFIFGYNGTIFAYGQTGTGKTFTVEGEDLSKDISPRHGLIPQTLSFIFKEIENLRDECATVQISFIELYNETAFDLLGPLMYGTNNRRDLPKVLVSLGASGSCSLHGLSIHDVSGEYEARKLHLNGRCNRTVAWNASNDLSSRSHAIFTILLTRQQQNSEVVIKSKLNLVDLAGSESLSKTGGHGSSSLNTETKQINLSLHYLETVILSLQKLHLQESTYSHVEGSPSSSSTSSREDAKMRSKRCHSAHIPTKFFKDKLSSSAGAASWNRLKCQSAIGFSDLKRRGHSISVGTSPHISYRNSLLTMLLQDSLGGNCNTAMIATLSLEAFNFNETISTCRFAQRVARVTNNPVINKGIHEGTLIKKLQNKVSKLTKELLALKQNTVLDKNDNYRLITSEEKAKVIDIVRGYLDGTIGDPLEKGVDGPHKVRACLAYLKDLVIQNNHKFMSEPNSSDERDSGVGICSSIPTNNSEDEPCSPTLTACSGNSNGTLTNSTIACVPSPVVRPHSTERKVATPSSSQCCFASSNATKQTVQPQNAERCVTSAPSSRRFFPSISAEGGCTTGDCGAYHANVEKKLLLWELELQKQKLIQRSKLLSTALANQKARILVMEKHGCPLDETDNERLAEQQLRRKQTEVEQHLSVIIKRIVEAKSANNSGPTAIIDDKKVLIGNKPHALESRKLELQEHSTRLQLLSIREKLVPGLLSSFGKLSSKPQLIQEEQEACTDDGSMASFDTSTSTSPAESPQHAETFNFVNQMQNTFAKQSIKTSKIESPYEIKMASKSQPRTYSASGSRRTTVTDIKRRSRLSILNSRPTTRRQSSKSQLGPKAARPSTCITTRRGIGSPSNLLQRKSKHIPSHGSYLQHPSISSYSDSKASPAEREGKGLMKSAGSRVSSMMSVPLSLNIPSSRTRRPAMCSTVLTSQPSAARYNVEPNGFIFRTNNEVYKASGFKNDEFGGYSGAHNPSSGGYSEDVQRTHNSSTVQRTHNSSTGEYSEDVSRTQNSSSGGYSEDALNQEKDVSCSPVRERLPEVVTTEVIPSQLQAQTSLSIGSVNQPKHQASSESNPNNVPPPESGVPLKVSPIVVKARKQQLERAKRIREVTNAAEVIQGAYRQYTRQKKK